MSRFAILLAVALATGAAGASGEEIRLPAAVPSYNQAYRVGPGAWADCRLGTAGCPDRIGETGCLIAAFASVLGYFGVSLDVPASFSCTGRARTGVDPGILNDWLRYRNGYGRCTEDPVGNCCLEWGQLPDEVRVTFHVNRSETGVSPLAAIVIDRALRQGYPVIAGVHWGASCHGSAGTSEDCHWVVITGRSGGSYWIIDPYNKDERNPRGVRTTLEAGVHGRYIIDRFVVVAGPVPGGPTLSVGLRPAASVLRAGVSLEYTLHLRGWEPPVLIYALVTGPSGTARYAYYETSDPAAGDPIRYTATRTSLLPSPQALSAGWEAPPIATSGQAPGEWTWEIWAEDPAAPHVRIAEERVTYVLDGVSSTSGFASVLAALALLTIAAAVYIVILGRD